MTELKLALMGKFDLTSDEADDLMTKITAKINGGESADQVLTGLGIDSSLSVDLTA